MNMPHCLSQGGYTKNLEKIESSSLATFNNISVKSRDAIVNAYHEIGVDPDKDGVLDISVSFDGSWQKRGHSSHKGVASVIDLVTGFPIDLRYFLIIVISVKLQKVCQVMLNGRQSMQLIAQKI